MRKISKIIALILAIAMVLCPVLTAAAETEDVVYSTATLNLLRDESGAIAVDENGKSTAIVTVTTLEAVNAIDFQINFAKGVAFDISADTVAIDGIDTWSVQKGYKDGVLTVAAYDNSANFDQAQTEVVFNITVTIADLGEHEFYLSKIFAVGEGEANAEYVASFKYADEAQSGVIDVVTAKTDAEVDYFETTSCLHPNTTIVTTDATCTEAGSVVETCDDCGKVISSETTDPLGHSYDNMNELCCLEVAYDGALYAVYDAKCAVCGTLNVKYYDAEGNLTANLAELAETDEENVVWLEDIAPEHDIATEWSYNEAGHWHDCSCGEQHDYADHTWDEGTVTTPAQPGVAGVMTYACTAACGATKTEEIPALPKEPEVVDSITITPNINITQTINLRFTFGSIPVCDDFYVELVTDRCDSTYNFIEGGYTKTVYKADMATLSGDRYYFMYSDARLFELNLPITLKVYCLDANDNVIYVSNTLTTTVADEAKAFYAKSSNAKAKTLYSDIIELASIAQTYFVNGKDVDLADVALPNEGFTGTPSGDIDVSSLNATYIPSEGTTSITPSFNLAGNPAIRFTVAGVDGYELADLKLVIEYTSPKYTITPETYNFSELATLSGGRYYAVYSQVALCDGNQNVTAKVYNGEVSEANLVSSTVYSIEYAIANTKSTSRAYTLYMEVAKLGASARAYFGL